MKKEIILIKWSSFNFKFEHCLSELSDVELKTSLITHHKSWFSKNRNHFKELVHLIKQFLPLMYHSLNSNVVVFGTNACRIMYLSALFNKKIVLIINEMPERTYILERFFLRRLRRRVFLSNESRLEYIEKLIGGGVGGVIPNIPLCFDISEMDEKIESKVIYAGLINKSRLSADVFDKIENTSYSLDLMGPIVEDNMDVCKSTYLGVFSQVESQKIQRKYRFGLLSYSIKDVNNNLCAPIKVYEYINNGCVCILVNDNEGLIGFSRKYRSLFVRLEELHEYVFDKNLFEKERAEFFCNENKVLLKSIERINDCFD
ncbi:hypothetical protein [Shewanella insulae]|uniref:hypothetical protein n=1 Tax=Shewanella insulae TaxID=2681496 RepID=UPI0024812AF3|nr:hypothetical protein [Shewanella insulae]